MQNARVHISLYPPHVTNFREHLQAINKQKYDSFVFNVGHQLIHRKIAVNPDTNLCEEGCRPDTILSPNEWFSNTIAKVSSKYDLDAEDDAIRKRDEAAFDEEMSFAEHLVQAGDILMTLPLHGRGKSINLARNVSRSIKGTLVVEVPMQSAEGNGIQWRKDKESESQTLDTWTAWNDFRVRTHYHPQIKLALEMPDEIPSKLEIKRWLGEPIMYIVVPTRLFTHNSKRCPVLLKRHQELLEQMIQITPNFLIKVTDNRWNPQNYCEYIQHLANLFIQADTMSGYENLLETPLQPLYNNLDAYTYEVFEKDPIKYKLYQDAIELAMLDKVPRELRKGKTIVVMILGAGRGPLVRSTINAGIKAGVKTKIYIVEKNLNAIVAIRANIAEIWTESDITLYSCDMRDFNPPEKADILVSELLGSFGDNELSPECLDGAQKHLKPDGISIPSNSISYVNPVMSSKLFNGCRSVDRFQSVFKNIIHAHPNNFETTYVVYPKTVFHIAPPQKVFTFEHPNSEVKIDNSRFKTLNFTANIDCVLHGFIGYFESTLYKNIMLSIHPLTHTEGMASWFAFYFPINIPQMVKEGQDIEVSFWRCLSKEKVWYEWAVSKPNISHIHNANGDVCHIFK